MELKNLPDISFAETDAEIVKKKSSPGMKQSPGVYWPMEIPFGFFFYPSLSSLSCRETSSITQGR